MGAPLRIARLCSVFEPPPGAERGRGVRFDPIGGMQNHTACLTRALDGLGVEQAVVTTRPPGAERHQRVGRAAAVRRVGLPVPWMRQGWAPLSVAPLWAAAAGADLIHAHLGEDLAVLPLARAAARRRGVPLVATVHLSLQHTFSGGGPRDRALQRLGGRVERSGLAAADAVIALTPRLAELLVDGGVAAERVHVIPSGVEPRLFRAAEDPLGAARPGPRVVYVGRLARQKGVATLVRAAAELRTPGLRVDIVGDGPLRGELEALARRLGVTDRVHFHGFVAHDHVPGVLGGADVVVLPSVYEELGSVLLEALQAGAPIVASDVGGIPFAVGDAALLVPPSQPAPLAAAIDRVLQEDGLALRLSALARERAVRFDWGALGREVLDVYRSALGARTAFPSLPEPAPDAVGS